MTEPHIKVAFNQQLCSLCKECPTGLTVASDHLTSVVADIQSKFCDPILFIGKKGNFVAFPPTCEHPEDGIVCPCSILEIMIVDIDNLEGYA